MLRRRKNEKGIALMSSLFFLIIVTVLASTAIMLATVQMKVASSVARWESGFACAEGAMNYVIPLIKYVHFDSQVPSQYCSSLVEPCMPVGAGIHALVNELQMSYDDPDAEDLHILPSSAQNFDGLDVSIDIDALGVGNMAGGSIEASWAYHGGSTYSSSLMKAYRIDVTCRTLTGSSRTRVGQVIWIRAVL